MIKSILYDEEMRTKILSGIDKVTDAIGKTLGPAGRNTVLYKKAEIRDAKWSDKAGINSRPIVINDGVTIAKSIILPDPVENIGSSIIIEASEKTNEMAGDGTSTTAVLTRSMVKEGFRLVAAGANPILLKNGLEKISALVEKELVKMAEPVDSEEKLSQIAAISCGDKETGNVIGHALYEVGLEGIIRVDDYGAGAETKVKIDEGIVFNRGFVNPLMADDDATISSDLADPYILITDYKIESLNQIIDLLIEVAEADGSLVIIAESVEPEIVAMILKNKMEGDMKIVAINPPLFGEGRDWRLDDLAVQTGASYITKKMGRTLKDTHIEDLGHAERVIITKNETTITGPGGDVQAVSKRVNYLRHLIAFTDYDFNKKRYEERLAQFVSGIATITPGGCTTLEIEEKKFKIEDAINAARTSYAEGIVPGGGTAFIDCISVVDKEMQNLAAEEKYSAQIIIDALKAPLYQIAENAGMNGSVVVNRVLEEGKGIGFNAVTGKYEDMKKAGIIDPARVSILAFKSAASIASTLLSTSAAVVKSV